MVWMAAGGSACLPSNNEHRRVGEHTNEGDIVSRSALGDLNENWATWLQFTADHAAGGASQTFGAIRCSSVGVPMPLFNQAFVFEQPSLDDLTQATRSALGAERPVLGDRPGFRRQRVHRHGRAGRSGPDSDNHAGNGLRAACQPPGAGRQGC